MLRSRSTLAFRARHALVPPPLPYRVFIRHAGAARATPPRSSARSTASELSPSIEDTYTRKTPVEHVLLRPGMYVGSTESVEGEVWCFDASRSRMARRAASHVPALLKLFDEVLVNACDNAQRDPAGMTAIDVEIDAGSGSSKPPRLRVRNDGRGIPIAQHATERGADGRSLFVHELVFGHLLTGSNFSSGDGAAVAATTGGQHGYGAKLANIFSQRFAVRGVDAARRVSYEQTWSANMSAVTPPLVKSLATGKGDARDSTDVEFVPDMARFARGTSATIDEGTYALMHRRVLDAAGTLALAAGNNTRVAVTFNGKRVPVDGWAEYLRLFVPSGARPPAPVAAPASSAPPLSGSKRGKGVAVAAANSAAAAETGADAASPPTPAWSLLSLAAGVKPAAAASLLASIQTATLTGRLEVGAGVAGLRLADSGWSDGALTQPQVQQQQSQHQNSPEPLDADAFAAYNTPGAFASFVNCLATPRGGGHVRAVFDALSRRLADYCQKRLKRVAAASASLSPAGGADDDARVAAARATLADAVASAVITPALIRAHLRIAVNVRLSSPAFDSQSKESLVSPPESVIADVLRDAGGSVGTPPPRSASALADAMDALFPDAFVRRVAEEGGVLLAVVSSIAGRAASDLARSVRRPAATSDNKVRSIPKLEDANWAGGRRAAECTLILTEGDSAKALAVAGLAEVGRDAFGVFPLRGKLLNVRDVSLKDALENAEVSALMAILGLDLAKTHEGGARGGGLRYGRVMIMADQDVDGSHIKGLIVNLFHTFWPRLLDGPGAPFLQQFVTPVLKARAGAGATARVRDFFNLRDFDAWRRGEPVAGTTTGEGTRGGWTVKYYKGLGTSTSAEGRAYFRAIASHTRSFSWGGASDDEALRLAFSRDRADDRKTWLAAAAAGHGDADRSARAHAPTLDFAHFVHDELVDFSLADLARSIPSVLDGLKPSQRKVLFATLRRSGRARNAGGGAGAVAAVRAAASAGRGEEVYGDEDEKGGAEGGVGSGASSLTSSSSTTSEIKVAQLSGFVAEQTAYHHGEASLVATIVSMAQDFVGSNNVPLLLPLGQFGTRLAGGKDAASARYIFTRLSPLARAFFPAADDDFLRAAEDDGARVEPVAYLPVVPFALVNGATGIGTGWSTAVPPHHPLEVLRAVRTALDAGWPSAAKLPTTDPFPLLPWWRGFSGHVDPIFTAALGGDAPPTLDGVVTAGIAEWEGGGGGGAENRSGAPTSVGGGGLGSLGGVGDYLDGLALSEDASSLSTPNGATAVRITELPIGKWTETYKAFLHGLVADGLLKSVKEFHTEARAEFLVSLSPAGVAAVRAAAAVGGSGSGGGGGARAISKKGGSGGGAGGVLLTRDAWKAGLAAVFKLSAPLSMRNMHLFDAQGRIARFGGAWDVVRAWLPARAEGYAARAACVEAALARAATAASAQARFLDDVRAGRLVLGKANKVDLEVALAERGFPAGLGSASAAASAPVVVTEDTTTPLTFARIIDTARVASWRIDAAAATSTHNTKSATTGGAAGTPPRGSFDYLLNLPLSRLTNESAAKSRAEAVALEAALKKARGTRPEDVWRGDLDALEAALRGDGFTERRTPNNIP